MKRAGDGAYQRPGVDATNPETALTALERARRGFPAHASSASSSSSSCAPAAGRRSRWPKRSIARSCRKPSAPLRGDDTILVIARDARRAAALVKRLEGYAGL